MQKFFHAGCGVKKTAMEGAASIELALLLVPLLLLTIGGAEYGRALYHYNTLVKTVRDAARFLSQYNPTDPASYEPAIDDARCLAVYGNTACSGAPLIPGLTTGMVDIESTSETTTAGTSITFVDVRITGYPFEFAFNPLRLVGNAEAVLPFNDIHATMRQL